MRNCDVTAAGLTGVWNACSDTLPEECRRVLCYCTNGEIRILWRDNWATLWVWTDNESPYFDNEEVTHWMPLPEPPESVTK